MSVKTYSLKKDGEKQLSEDFKVKEFRCKDGTDKILVSPETVKILQSVRDYFGKIVHINSAYRTPAYNKKVGGASASQHVKGTACDIRVDGVPPVSYTHLDVYKRQVFNITNGYQQVEDWANSISITNQTTLTGTVQKTITAYRPRTINEIVPLDKGGTGATTAAAARVKLGAATKPTVTTITLTAAGWTGSSAPYTQTVTVAGILADESKQLIQPIPAEASKTAYAEAGVYASLQAANSLTFSCSEKPAVDLKVYIVIQEVA